MDKLVSQTVRRTPIIAPPRPAELPQPGRFADGKSVQPVLIVIEKDHELADAIVDMGERRGYIGTGVPDISLAKQMLGGLGKNQPHLIIADKNPETDPRELGDLFSAVKTANPNSKTIVFEIASYFQKTVFYCYPISKTKKLMMNIICFYNS